MVSKMMPSGFILVDGTRWVGLFRFVSISDSCVYADGLGAAMPPKSRTRNEENRPISALDAIDRPSFSSVCIWASLISSIRFLLRRMEAGPLTVGCLVPDGIDPALYELAWDKLCAKAAWKIRISRSDSSRTFIFPSDQKSAKLNGLSSGDRWCAAFASHVDDVPAWFMSYAEEVILIRSITVRDMQAAARLTLGFSVDAKELEGIDVSRLTSYDHIFQVGRRRAHITKALQSVTGLSATEKSAHAPESVTLEDLPGMGAATVWANEVIRDLEDWKAGKIKWADVDRGIVLYGPPGTGKSTFAKAMAGSAKIPLITGSIAKWQSSGHLGDMLKSMRAAFTSAVRQAPSILLIDEIDVVGDRAKFDSQHRDYDNKVVAALLELLDGAEAREGVVVIGTSNFHPREVLDPALIRPGRLEAWVEIRMPDHAARIEILRAHGATISEAELARVAERTEERTGAELEALVRAAKRFARRDARAQCIDDYLRALPRTLPLSDSNIRRTAIHECGHALAAVTLNHGRLDRIRIIREIEEHTIQIAAGRTMIEMAAYNLRSRSDLEAEIVVMLAGMAAEEMIYGEWTEGSGCSETSDLGHATSIALSMSGTFGMQGSLARVVNDPRTFRIIDSGLRRSVDEILGSAMERARAIVREGKDALIRMSELLIAKGELTQATVLSIIEENTPQEAFGDRH